MKRKNLGCFSYHVLSHVLTYNQGSFSEILQNGCISWETLNLVAECLFQLSWCWVSCPCLGCVTWLGSAGRKGGSAGGFLSCREYWCTLLVLHFACCYSSVRNGALRSRQERWFHMTLLHWPLVKSKASLFQGKHCFLKTGVMERRPLEVCFGFFSDLLLKVQWMNNLSDWTLSDFLLSSCRIAVYGLFCLADSLHPA